MNEGWEVNRASSLRSWVKKGGNKCKTAEEGPTWETARVHSGNLAARSELPLEGNPRLRGQPEVELCRRWERDPRYENGGNKGKDCWREDACMC